MSLIPFAVFLDFEQHKNAKIGISITNQGHCFFAVWFA
ncbi:conserved hypothetical protein [Lacticaseibacillus rhamnosus ATCC 8530]|nr:conserved hypothetical protein [Lacticaseibacillus rhamnosus ATCC 8530]